MKSEALHFKYCVYLLEAKVWPQNLIFHWGRFLFFSVGDIALFLEVVGRHRSFIKFANFYGPNPRMI